MNEYGSRRNRKYVFVMDFNQNSVNDALRYGEAISNLSSLSARMNSIIGKDTIILYVFCRTNKSKVYRKCIELGFRQF